MNCQEVIECAAETVQTIIDKAPAAFQYCTDGFSIYATLNYHGLQLVAEGKSQTYSVEDGNAGLRHYLKNLA
jgi:IS1 family transposase